MASVNCCAVATSYSAKATDTRRFVSSIGQRRGNRQSIFRRVDQKQIARFDVGRARSQRARGWPRHPTLAASRSNDLRKPIDRRVELGDQPVRRLGRCARVVGQRDEIVREALERSAHRCLADASAGIARAPLVNSSVAACRNPCGGMNSHGLSSTVNTAAVSLLAPPRFCSSVSTFAAAALAGSSMPSARAMASTMWMSL